MKIPFSEKGYNRENISSNTRRIPECDIKSCYENVQNSSRFVHFLKFRKKIYMDSEKLMNLFENKNYRLFDYLWNFLKLLLYKKNYFDMFNIVGLNLGKNIRRK